MDAPLLSELLPPGHVLADPRITGKAALLDLLTRRAIAGSNLDPATVLRLIAEREALGSTGIGKGIGLPHARVPGLLRPIAAFARLARPLPFDAIDDQPVDLVFLLLSPSGAQSPHLAALAAISRRLRDPARVAAIRAADQAGLHRLLIAD